MRRGHTRRIGALAFVPPAIDANGVRRSATILGLLAMLALTACGRVGFDRGGFTDAVAGSCVATSPSDDFEVSELPACASWGSTSTNGLDLARVAGALAIDVVDGVLPAVTTMTVSA